MANAHSSAPSSSTSHGRPVPHPFLNPVGPPSKHQLAVMIWMAVFPTLTVLNLSLGPWLADLGAVLRTFVLATVAVPIVITASCPGCTASACASSPGARPDQKPFPDLSFARTPPTPRRHPWLGAAQRQDDSGTVRGYGRPVCRR